MVKVFKLVYSLKLINVYFGNILEAFMESIGGVFDKRPPISQNSEIYSVKFRGKLTYSRISTLSNDYLYLKYVLVLFTGLLSITEFLFKLKISRAKFINHNHLIYLNLVDTIKTTIFYSVVYDIGIYTVHELLHHDLYISNSGSAKVSYLISCVAFLYACMVLISSYYSLRKISLQKLVDCDNIKQKIEKSILNDKEMTQKVRMFMAKDIYAKEYSYCFGTSRIFFLTGLNFYRIDNYMLKTIKLNSVVKVIIFSILINCLQILPKV